MKEYDAYIRFPDKLEDGQELKMIVRNRDDFCHTPVLARVYWSGESHPDKSPLHILTPLGLQHGKTWAVEILETLGEDELLDSSLHLCAEFKGGV